MYEIRDDSHPVWGEGPDFDKRFLINYMSYVRFFYRFWKLSVSSFDLSKIAPEFFQRESGLSGHFVKIAFFWILANFPDFPQNV